MNENTVDLSSMDDTLESDLAFVEQYESDNWAYESEWD